MYLKRLELHGFKSFGKKTVFDFSNEKSFIPITALVGPNGAGKSNVADAVRWVLGEQSAKALRGVSSEDVIFHGSDRTQQSRTASVSLVFDNSDKALPCEFEEVVVTRKVIRGEGSEYRLNNSICRLLDIQELLAHGRMSQRSYCIVNQGLADALLRATPLERRELLEDAIGVKPYQIRKHYTELKLARAERNMQRTEDRLGELRPRLVSLQRQMAAVERRRVIEKQLKEAQQSWYLGNYGVRIVDRHALVDRQGECQKRLDQAMQQVQEASAALVALRDSRQMSSQKKLGLEEQYRDLQQQWNAAQQELLLRRSALSQQDSGIQRTSNIPERLQELSFSESQLREQLEKEQQHRVVAIQGHEHEQSNIATQTAQLDKLLRELKKLESDQTVQVWDRSHLAASLRVLRESHMKFRKQFQEASQSGDFSTLEEAFEHLVTQLDEICVHCSPSTTQVQELDSWKMIQRDLSEVRSSLDHHRSQAAEARVAVQTSEQACEFYEGQLLEIVRKKHRLEQELSDQQQLSRNDQTVQLRQQIQHTQSQLDSFEVRRVDLRTKLQSLEESEYRLGLDIQKAELRLRHCEQERDRSEHQVHGFQVELASMSAHIEELEHEIRRELGVSFLDILRERKDWARVSVDASLEDKIFQLRHRAMACGEVDPLVEEEYVEIRQRTEFLEQQLTDLSDSIASMRSVIDELCETIDETFRQSFCAIQESFSKYFQLLFDGGEAKLLMVQGSSLDEDAGQEIQSGVDIIASPPGKKVRHVGALSGGERAITSIALLFAVMSNNPPPFSILDEVEAALDEINTKRFGRMLQQLSPTTQFIVITHKRETMNVADLLYGVTMKQDGLSQLLSVQLDDAESVSGDLDQ